MTKISGSSQRHGSADLDPHQNVMDPQHCSIVPILYHLLVSGSSSSSATSVCPASPRSAPPSPEPMMDLDPAHSAPATQPRQEKPIFTLKQMTMIAERMCKVRQNMVTFFHFRTEVLRVWISFGSPSRMRLMRSSRVVRASDSHCRSRNCPGFDPSILWNLRGGR